MLVHAPRFGVVLQSLQPRLDQIQRLEEQRGAGAAQRAAHEGFESRVSLRMTMMMEDRARDEGTQERKHMKAEDGGDGK